MRRVAASLLRRTGRIGADRHVVEEADLAVVHAAAAATRPARAQTEADELARERRRNAEGVVRIRVVLGDGREGPDRLQDRASLALDVRSIRLCRELDRR